MAEPDIIARRGWKLRALIASLCFVPVAPASAETPSDPGALLEHAASLLCEMPDTQPKIPGAVEIESSAVERSGVRIGWRYRFSLAKGSELLLVVLGPEAAFRRINVQYSALIAGLLQPVMMISADSQCRTQMSRRLVYAADGRAEAVERLDVTLTAVELSEPLNPAVPQGEGFDGVRVALVDSGVNYLLEALSHRLARDQHGMALGYDFWDLDRRPFDANPARSPFFPQRHGTKTASLLLGEAPVASLLAYRYPRPDMARMGALVEDAAGKDVIIMNVSMGSSKRADWDEFSAAVKAHPDMLFVVSAGNDGRDIDTQPIYPAVLEHSNLITVTSVDDGRRPAPGSNWGARSVHLGVPAESMLVTDFHGRPTLASGSSYAAVRISALAACLQAANPDWRAAELKKEIFALASPVVGNGFVSVGVLSDPDESDRGGCKAARTTVERISSEVLALSASNGDERTHELRPSLVLLQGTGWNGGDLVSIMQRAARVLAQCGVQIAEFELHVLAVPELMKYFHDVSARRLATALPLPRPSVYLVKDTLQAEAFEAEAIGLANSRGRPELAHTVWLTRALEPPGVGLAHELAHVLMDSGAHSGEPGNLMSEQVSVEAVALTLAQCQRMTHAGADNGLLEPIAVTR